MAVFLLSKYPSGCVEQPESSVRRITAPVLSMQCSGKHPRVQRNVGAQTFLLSDSEGAGVHTSQAGYRRDTNADPQIDRMGPH
jgi:hypothetical protein